MNGENGARVFGYADITLAELNDLLFDEQVAVCDGDRQQVIVGTQDEVDEFLRVD